MKKREKFLRYMSMFMAINILFEVVSPTLAFGLTNGPSQPDFMSFEPANSSEMVDLFTGDFKYNIPLMDVDGYPLNLAYHAGQNMDAEASWVGLGWTMNPGVLNRMVKGLPDDFNGEKVRSKTNIKPHVTMGVGFQMAAWFGQSLDFENQGVGTKIGANYGASGGVVLSYNNYKGFGLEIEADAHGSLSRSVGYGGFATTATKSQGVGLSVSSQDGGSLSENHSNGVGVSFEKAGSGASISASMGQGTTINTRSGAVTKSYFSSAAVNVTIAKVGSFGVGMTRSSSLPAGAVSYSPRISNDMIGSGFGLSVKGGFWSSLNFYAGPIQLGSLSGGVMLGFKGFYNRMGMRDSVKTLPAFGYLYAENANESSLMDFNRFKDGPIMDETPNLSYATQTYDMFSATGQGMSNMFRAHRGDNINVHDNNTTISSNNDHAGIELGGPLIVHYQQDVTNMYNTGYSGRWQTMTDQAFSFVPRDIKVAANRFYEKYFFKSFGEITGRDATYDASVGGDGPTSPVLIKIGDDYHAGTPISAGARTKRDSRNTNIRSLTGDEATKFGYEPTYDLYTKIVTSNTSSYPIIDPNTKLVTPDASKSNIGRTTKTIFASSKAIGHHLSEISMTNPSGSTYVYGIPVYNLHKKRVMFNASNRKETPYQQNGWPTTAFGDSPLGKSHAYQLVEYDNTSGTEEININYRGYDNLYREDVTPAFASSFLLTTILSEDYVDIEADGPSYDDIGNFTKFNYYKNNEYGWREPFPLPVGASNQGSDWTGNNNGSPALSSSSNKSQANFEKGMLADNLDDKGFYEYGVRENYYVHSIETKDFLAVFETSDRLDEFGVSNEHGTIIDGENQKLDAIKLYSKNDILNNGGQVLNTTPLKTVRFEYDYSLCPGTFNTDVTNAARGKLTLKKVYFSYGNSEKSALTPYVFSYASNYSYNPRSVDRWGSYMPNTMLAESGLTTQVNGAYMNSTEYPYAIQNKSLADAYSAAWNLNQIQTPSGSIIKINYESDDYGYVQNEQAAQMTSIYNIVDDPINPAASVQSSYGTPNGNIKDASFMIIDMSNMHRGIPITGQFSNLNVASNFVKTNVFKPKSDLYFKVFTKLAGPPNSFGIKNDYFDYVPGYAYIEDSGVFDFNASNNTYTDGTGNTCYRYAYVRIKKEIAWDSKDVCPVTIAGWDMLRNYLPRVAYPGSEPANMGNNGHKPKKQFMNMLTGVGVAIKDMMNGVAGKPNKRFYKKNFCTQFIREKSFVRAYNPFKHKLGGGYRVKSITSSDRWNSMTGTSENETSYGQSYDYTVKEGKYIISSGVAMYEPLIGGDEISLRKPIKFTIQKSMAPNDHWYQEMPYGEMLYPAPVVGYSKVTVTTLPDPENPSPPEVCKIGKTEFEFYTAKEFPITFNSTDMAKKPVQNPAIADYIVLNNLYKIFHAAQGHALKMNDMHGKLKAVLAYGEDNLTTPISGTRYFYKASGSLNGTKQLITTLPTINENNQVQNTNMCKDTEITLDTGENISETISSGMSFVFEMGINIIFLPPPVYISVVPGLPSMIPNAISGQQRFGMRQATITKVVQQYGVIDRVEQFDNKSKVTTQNLLWDKNTGEVVLTKTTDNFDQQVYNFNYPAYWVYPRLGHKFNREGIELLCPTVDAATIWDITTGILKKSAITNPLLFDSGDEVIVMKADGTKIGGRFWVHPDVYSMVIPEPWYLLDQHGTILNSINYPTLAGDCIIKLIKPNNQNNLYTSVGAITSLNNPVVGSALQFTTATKVLDANVQEFCTASSMFINNSIPSYKYTNVTPSYTSNIFNFVVTGFNSTLRPTASYAYKTVRTYSVSQPNAKQDGVYSKFTPFWKYSAGKWINASAPDWQKTNNNKYYSPYGQLIESENAILVPSSQKYGFNHTLVSLNASNAKYEEVGFDSFEEYINYSTLNSIEATSVSNNDYLTFYEQMLNASSPPATTTITAHTGRTSLAFQNGNSVKLNFDTYKTNPFPYNGDNYIGCQSSILNMSKLNLNGGTLGKKYILSMWVKGATQSLDFSPNVSFSGNLKHFLNPSGTSNVPISINLVNKSGIINGWQKLDYELTIPPASAVPGNWSYSNFELTISSASAFNLDDFRVQPFNSSMTCFVYDNLKYRMVAQLDDRNYATILEYDNENMLVRKKKETLNGLVTIQETRKGIAK